LFSLGLVCAAILILSINKDLPDYREIKNIELKIPLRVFAADGGLIAEFGDERRKPLESFEIPQVLVQAITASEDADFFKHGGIDLFGIARAIITNFKSGDTQQGASTITQQVARNFFLTRDKTYYRKIREILLAVRLEQILTKDEILRLYVNKIFLGHRAYGFGAASQVYYGKDIEELNLAQTAMLAGLPKAPSAYNPLANPDRALIRRNYVLGRMLALEMISEQQHEQARAAEVSAAKHQRPVSVAAHYVAEMVRASLLEELGEQAYWAGLNVYTTIEPELQASAQQSLRKGIDRYERRHGYRGAIANHPPSEWQTVLPQDYLKDFPKVGDLIPGLVTEVKKSTLSVQLPEELIKLKLKDNAWVQRAFVDTNVRSEPRASFSKIFELGDLIYLNPLSETQEPKYQIAQIPQVAGSILSVEPKSGKLIALVGGYDFFYNKYNRAVQAIRQPGSNIKPFIYSASLDKGYSPASKISGAPIVVRDETNNTVWRPQNYSGEFFGPTRMRAALSKSMNLVSIRLLRAIGIPYTREYLSRFGLPMQRFSPTLTMALGSGGATPLEVMRAYNVLANGGYLVEPYFISHITDRHGETVYQQKQPLLCDECFTHFPDAQAIEQDQESQSENAIKDDTASESVPSEEVVNEQGDSVGEIIGDILSIEDSDVYLAPRVMSKANHFQTVSMMQDVIRLGTGRKALALNRTDLAGKTGTTNDYVDAWFSGFSPDLTTTVWIGYDEPKSMGRGEAGSRTALPIWVDFNRVALKDVPNRELQIPDTVEEVWINKETLQLSSEGEPWAIKEYFQKQGGLSDSSGLVDSAKAINTGRMSDSPNSLNPKNQEGPSSSGSFNSAPGFNTAPGRVAPPTGIRAQEDQSINTEGLF